MEKIRISKVEDVTLWRRGTKFDGTLHLAQHHLIFSYIPQPQTNEPRPHNPKPREVWITYPMISFCTYRPVPATSRQLASIRLRCRDFTYIAFHFQTEHQASEVYETIKNLTCRLRSIDRLYAFSYQAQGPEKHVNGWNVYNPMQEWRRQGIGSKSANRGWRITQINKDYEYSPTYPSSLAVPASISDNVLNYAGRYRSRARIPVLTYLHPVNDCSISRSSQPLVGVRGNRSVQDEKLVGAIFTTPKPGLENGDSFGSDASDEAKSRVSSTMQTPRESTEAPTKDLENLEDVAIANLGRNSSSQNPDSAPEPRLYGAQQNNLIVDARPTVNAYAMQAVGKGSENMDHYPFATKAYLNIANIHVMRDSLNKVVEALRDGDITPLPPDTERLAKSGWLKHIAGILDGSSLIARQVGVHHSHVLIHCSDGWDRTGQLSAVSQLCLDPYFRTLEGFIVLVEKDFLAFGHMFRHRCGFLGSGKWFEVENERISSRNMNDSPFSSNSNRSAVGGKALENALLSAKGFFNKHTGMDHKDKERDALEDGEGEMRAYDSPMHASGTSSPGSRKDGDSGEKPTTKVKETSPVFHQFLDAVYQLLHQYPARFEFNERFLRRLLYQLYSCQYGTFLYDSEKQRVDARVSERTRSVWDYFLARKDQFRNDRYDGTIDDNIRGQERLLFPKCNEVRWWTEVFGRPDHEMNLPGTIPLEVSETDDASKSFDDLPHMSVLRAVETANSSETLSTTGIIPRERLGYQAVHDSEDAHSSMASMNIGVQDHPLQTQKVKKAIEGEIQ